MAHKVIDRCKETTSTTGTGNLTLAGAVAGFVTMANTLTGLTSNGDTSWFCAESGGQWEVFLGTRVSPTVLARTTVLSSSNAGSPVNFSSAPTVFSTVPGRAFYGHAFSGSLATSVQSISANTYTKVQLNSIGIDDPACWDYVNYRWQPVMPGYYHVSFAVGAATSSGTMTYTQALIRKNGTAEALGVYAQAIPNNMNSGGSKLVYMNGSTDYIELFVIANGAAPYVNIGVSNTYMTCHFVRGA